jgi:hypothetical protein
MLMWLRIFDHSVAQEKGVTWPLTGCEEDVAMSKVIVKRRKPTRVLGFMARSSGAGRALIFSPT